MTAAAAAATIASPSFAAFLSKLSEVELGFRAAFVLRMFAAHVAVPFDLDTRQALITYILLLTIPLLIYHLMDTFSGHSFLPRQNTSRKSKNKS
jgi:hypothetical protein